MTKQQLTWTTYFMLFAIGGCCLGTTAIDNTQTLSVRIVNVSNSDPVQSATVIVARDRISNLNQNLANLSDEEYFELFRDTAQTTDNDGNAVVVLESLTICSCVPCDTLQDTVDGEKFIALVETETTSEVLEFTAGPGVSVSGETFAFEVLNIGPAIAAEP